MFAECMVKHGIDKVDVSSSAKRKFVHTDMFGTSMALTKLRLSFTGKRRKILALKREAKIHSHRNSCTNKAAV